ncbi:MAG: hypothetical protein K2X27_23935 [Candidatus Obscuribacterales bacterium]|nr:hypothetical protein [Candidatus Obscuribacterales bacterium]
MQSIFPSRGIKNSERRERRLGYNLGPELALPLMLLVFILLSEQSALLRLQVDQITDWLCAHDSVATGIELLIAGIPFWMLAVIIHDKIKGKS